VFPDCLG